MSTRDWESFVDSAKLVVCGGFMRLTGVHANFDDEMQLSGCFLGLESR